MDPLLYRAWHSSVKGSLQEKKTVPEIKKLFTNTVFKNKTVVKENSFLLKQLIVKDTLGSLETLETWERDKECGHPW